ncbi:hypothetical protein [Alcanivorax sp. 24]|uniref:hypothetical protein n=1 Tax=Alcanivorax sp. 24 TaxID=2545266 RepID=UPI00105D8E74|nr:hypothetical protein [Alcanivorax sp. 24]
MATENLDQLMLSALGKGNKDDEVRKAFAEASLANWPDVADDREAAWNVEYWRYGCSLTFVETGQYEQLFDEHGIQGGLVAATSTFYLRGVDGFRAFPEEPPFGLTPGMKPDEVAACIGPVRASRVPYDRRVDLFFVDAIAGMASLLK